MEIEKAKIEVTDRMNTGLLLGVLYWFFDMGMNHLGWQLKNYQFFLALVMLGVAIFAPFFITQRVFRMRTWRLSQHEIDDRIWVVLFAATIQLALEFIGYWIFSPGKLVMTVLYAVIGSLAAISEFKKIERSPLTGIAKTRSFDVRLEKRKVKFASSILLVCSVLFQLLLTHPGLPFGSFTPAILLGLIIAAAISFYYSLSYGTCPQCNRRLGTEEGEGCEACRDESP